MSWITVLTLLLTDPIESEQLPCRPMSQTHSLVKQGLSPQSLQG